MTEIPRLRQVRRPADETMMQSADQGHCSKPLSVQEGANGGIHHEGGELHDQGTRDRVPTDLRRDSTAQLDEYRDQVPDRRTPEIVGTGPSDEPPRRTGGCLWIRLPSPGGRVCGDLVLVMEISCATKIFSCDLESALKIPPHHHFPWRYPGEALADLEFRIFA